MATIFNYTVSTDMPGGTINLSNLKSEILASAITIAFEGISVSGDALAIEFKADLPAGDKTILDGDIAGPAGGLLAAHDSTLIPDVDKVEIGLASGGNKMDVDGIGIQINADEWGFAYYAMPETFYVQGIHAQWAGMSLGDYAWITITHPTSGNPSAQASSGQADVDLGSAPLAAIFDPLNGAAYMEFWDESGATPALVEVRKIASVAGSVVTLAVNLTNTQATSIICRARYDGFSPVRGVDGTEGGFRLLNSGQMLLINEFGHSDAIPVGLNLCLRVRTTTDAGARSIALTFIFRKPLS